MDSRTDMVGHLTYSDGLTNTKYLMLMSSFIMEMSFEEMFVDFLKELLEDDKSECKDFKEEVEQLITEYEITSEQIECEIKKLIKIPVVS